MRTNSGIFRCRVARIFDARVLLILQMCCVSSAIRLRTPALYVNGVLLVFFIVILLPNRWSLSASQLWFIFSEQGLDEAIGCATASSMLQSSKQGSKMSMWTRLFKSERGSLAGFFRRRNCTSIPGAHHFESESIYNSAYLPRAKNRSWRRRSSSSSPKGHSSRLSGISSSSLRDQLYASIGYPSNFQHTIHVEVDDTSVSGFVGLPRDWDIRLMRTALSVNIAKPDIHHTPYNFHKKQNLACS